MEEIKCVFENENGKCEALTKKKCDNCNFYKTPEQLKNGRMRAIDRLKAVGIYENALLVYKGNIALKVEVE